VVKVQIHVYVPIFLAYPPIQHAIVVNPYAQVETKIALDPLIRVLLTDFSVQTNFMNSSLMASVEGQKSGCMKVLQITLALTNLPE